MTTLPKREVVASCLGADCGRAADADRVATGVAGPGLVAWSAGCSAAVLSKSWAQPTWHSGDAPPGTLEHIDLRHTAGSRLC